MDSQAFTIADVSARAQDYTVASWIHRPQPAPVVYINKKNTTIIGIHGPGETLNHDLFGKFLCRFGERRRARPGSFKFRRNSARLRLVSEIQHEFS